jgi:hypothetical protein
MIEAHWHNGGFSEVNHGLVLLRRAFVELFDARRAEISPATSLYELMPWKTRNKQ